MAGERNDPNQQVFDELDELLKEWEEFGLTLSHAGLRLNISSYKLKQFFADGNRQVPDDEFMIRFRELVELQNRNVLHNFDVIMRLLLTALSATPDELLETHKEMIVLQTGATAPLTLAELLQNN